MGASSSFKNHIKLFWITQFHKALPMSPGLISASPQAASSLGFHCLLVSIPSHLALAVYHDGPDAKFTPFTTFHKQCSLKRHMTMLKTWGSWRACIEHCTANNLEIPHGHNLTSKILSESLLWASLLQLLFLCLFSLVVSRHFPVLLVLSISLPNCTGNYWNGLKYTQRVRAPRFLLLTSYVQNGETVALTRKHSLLKAFGI